MEPRQDVSYYPDHQSSADTSTHYSHATQTNPQNPDSRHHPDSQYQPDARYPSQTDPRFPSYTERLDHPDGRYSVHTVQERPAVTPQRRPPPPVPQTPVHHHASGPGVREATLFI